MPRFLLDSPFSFLCCLFHPPTLFFLPLIEKCFQEKSFNFFTYCSFLSCFLKWWSTNWELILLILGYKKFHISSVQYIFTIPIYHIIRITVFFKIKPIHKCFIIKIKYISNLLSNSIVYVNKRLCQEKSLISHQQN